MSTAAARVLRGAWSAAGSFLRGFTGIVRSDDRAHAHGDPSRRCGDAQPTAASVRAALAERAARRPTCC